MATVLAVSPHPDDVEAGCAGTLLKHREAGDRVLVAVTTQGGYGVRSWELIQSEMREAERLLQIPYVVLDNPIGHYQVNWKTVTDIDSLIEREQVDIVYSVWFGDSHQDHQVTFKNVLAAARRKRIRSLYCYELPAYSYRSQHVFNARRYVDITPHLDLKLKAMAAYKSYYQEADLLAAHGLAAYRGSACGTRYAEAFEVIFETWIDLVNPKNTLAP